MPYSRRTFLEASIVTGALTGVSHPYLAHFGRHGGDVDSPPKSAPAVALPPLKPSFPVADYHVHLSNTLTIDQAVQLGQDGGVQIGILEQPRRASPP